MLGPKEIRMNRRSVLHFLLSTANATRRVNEMLIMPLKLVLSADRATLWLPFNKPFQLVRSTFSTARLSLAVDKKKCEF